jgi:CopG family nickel-responsive transcriptional regulator
MSDLRRLSISLEEPLLRRLERLRRGSGYANRSEFLRDLVRAKLVERAWEANEEAVGTITLVYDHHVRELGARLTQMQHDHHTAILATTHVHLDHDHCLEVILVRGRAGQVRRIADGLIQHKGVLHGALTMSATGRQLA